MVYQLISSFFQNYLPVACTETCFMVSDKVEKNKVNFYYVESYHMFMMKTKLKIFPMKLPNFIKTS